MFLVSPLNSFVMRFYSIQVELAHGGRGPSSSSDRRGGYGGGGSGGGGGGSGGAGGGRFGASRHSDYRGST